MSLPHQRLLPSIWKGDVRNGKVLHRIQVIGSGSQPVTFCGKVPVERMLKLADRYSSALCQRCDWAENPQT